MATDETITAIAITDTATYVKGNAGGCSVVFAGVSDGIGRTVAVLSGYEADLYSVPSMKHANSFLASSQVFG
jgi:hypothetical protein